VAVEHLTYTAFEDIFNALEKTEEEKTTSKYR
jgi:hypothetical protein